MIFTADGNPVFVPDLGRPATDSSFAVIGTMVSLLATSLGTGGITLPAITASGYFDSARPTQNEFIPTESDACLMFMKLMPRGRAYGTHDLASGPGSSAIWQFWCALATEWVVVERMVVDMVDEAFCAYSITDRDGWKADYLLPDEEDVYGDDVCAKVYRPNGVNLDEYQRIAEAIGWDILELRFLKGDDDDYPGVVSTLLVRASIDSPIIPEIRFLGIDFILGTSPLGSVGVPEAVARLTGLYDRIVPAHVDLIIEVV